MIDLYLEMAQIFMNDSYGGLMYDIDMRLLFQLVLIDSLVLKIPSNQGKIIFILSEKALQKMETINVFFFVLWLLQVCFMQHMNTDSLQEIFFFNV